MRIDFSTLISWTLAAALMTAPLPLRAQEEPGAGALRIEHTPITFSARGQPITMKVKIVGPEENVDSVTLYYALFKDAAPFRVPMRSSGLGLYVGTIEAGLLTGVDSVSYYIEAMDKNGALSETSWQTITFKDPSSKVPAPAPTAAPAPKLAPPAQDIKPTKERSSAATVGIIAGGAAAVVAGALLLSDSGGGGGGSSSGGDTNLAQKAGTYNGSVTRCFTPSGDSSSCSNHAMNIVIDSHGGVFTETLHPGQSLHGQISGSSFTLAASADDQGPDTTGDVIYNGTVINNNHIVGSISGSATSSSGSGDYSGSFSANKQ